MGSDLRYNLINSFRSIDIWRANLVFNMIGSVTPGFKKRDIFLGVTTGDSNLITGQAGSEVTGTRMGAVASNSELSVRGYKIVPTVAKPNREQGANAVQTHVSLLNDGFFAVAESMKAGSRIFFTRNGSFYWKKTGEVEFSGKKVPIYNLVNQQGLFVLRSKDIDFNPITGRTVVARPSADIVNDPAGMVLREGLERDGAFTGADKAVPGRIKGILGESKLGQITSVDDSQLAQFYDKDADHNSDLAIVKIPGAADLVPSTYGGDVYEAPLQARRGIVKGSVLDWFLLSRDSRKLDVPHVLPYALEYLDAKGTLEQLNIETESANFVYRNLSTFLQDYNKGIDDLLGIVR